MQVDDGWSASGPSEMDKDAVAKMGASGSRGCHIAAAALFNSRCLLVFSFSQA